MNFVLTPSTTSSTSKHALAVDGFVTRSIWYHTLLLYSLPMHSLIAFSFTRSSWWCAVMSQCCKCNFRRPCACRFSIFCWFLSYVILSLHCIIDSPFGSLIFFHLAVRIALLLSMLLPSFFFDFYQLAVGMNLIVPVLNCWAEFHI